MVARAPHNANASLGRRRHVAGIFARAALALVACGAAGAAESPQLGVTPASGLVDAQSFLPSANSPARNKAGVVEYIKDDFYHKPRYRRNAADVGAVERQ